MYDPKIGQLSTHATLLTPEIVDVLGVVRKVYQPAAVPDIFIAFKSRGGTEVIMNGVLVIIDTAEVTTWYREDLTRESRIKLDDGREYEIIGEPEDIELRHRWLRFKVQRVTGGA